jgi:flagellar biosynthesis protein FlhG
MNYNQQIVIDKPKEQPTRVMSFTSGKGGVGKSTSVLNIAIALAQQGKRTLLLDADLGLANIHVLLGKKLDKNLEHFFAGQCELEELFIEGPYGLIIIPAASGTEHMIQLSSEKKLQLLLALEETPFHFDYLFIDTQAGIGADVMYFNTAADEIVCVITPDPTSLTDAYALIKILARRYSEKEISILVNQVAHIREAQQSYQRLADACERHLQIRLKYLGSVPSDSAVVKAVRSQSPLMQSFPLSQAAKSLRDIADGFAESFYQKRIKGGLQFYFKKLLEVSNDISAENSDGGANG